MTLCLVCANCLLYYLLYTIPRQFSAIDGGLAVFDKFSFIVLIFTAVATPFVQYFFKNIGFLLGENEYFVYVCH